MRVRGGKERGRGGGERQGERERVRGEAGEGGKERGRG